VTKVYGNSIPLVASLSKSVTKWVTNFGTLVVTGDMGSEFIGDGSGYYRAQTGLVEDGEDRVTTVWTSSTAGADPWTSNTTASAVWVKL
jgi:hypothetical protein